jgi:hypothetical protein
MSNTTSFSGHTSFDELRNEVYMRLRRHFKLESDTSKRFLPLQTAQTVLQDDVLHDVYRHVQLERALKAEAFVERIKRNGLHTYLAILLYASCSQDALVNFARNLVAGSSLDSKRSQKELAMVPTTLKLAEEVLGDPVGPRAL